MRLFAPGDTGALQVRSRAEGPEGRSNCRFVTFFCRFVPNPLIYGRPMKQFVRPNFFMKRVLSALVVSAVIASSALAASVSYTNTVAAGSSYTDIALNKFDSNLGTLTGVVVTVNFATLQGSFTVSNLDPTQVYVDSYDSKFSVRQKASNTLGYTAQNNITLSSVGTSPDWATTPIAASGSQTFSISAGQNIPAIASQSIGAGFFSAYTAAGGAGTVIFEARDTQSITTTGATYTVDSSLASALTRLSVTYTYDAGPSPVPEPSTVMAGGLLVLIGAGTYLQRRRKSAGA